MEAKKDDPGTIPGSSFSDYRRLGCFFKSLLNGSHFTIEYAFLGVCGFRDLGD